MYTMQCKTLLQSHYDSTEAKPVKIFSCQLLTKRDNSYKTHHKSSSLNEYIGPVLVSRIWPKQNTISVRAKQPHLAASVRIQVASMQKVLSRSAFRGSVLRSVLRSSVLRKSVLKKSVLRRSVLRRSIFRSSVLRRSLLRSAPRRSALSRSEISRSVLRRSELRRSVLKRSVLRQSELRRSALRDQYSGKGQQGRQSVSGKPG